MNKLKGPKFRYLLVPASGGPAGDSGPQEIPILDPFAAQPVKGFRQNFEYSDFHEKSFDFFEQSTGQRCAGQQNISANQLTASGIQAEGLPGPTFLVYTMFGVIPQLACKPSIQKGVWTPEGWSLGPSGHQMITNCAHHSSLFQQFQVLLMKIQMGLLTFE